MNNIFIVFVFFAFIVSCRKMDNCPRYFQIPASIEPTQREYRIGDTLTIISKFHKGTLAFNSDKKEIGKFDMEGIRWMPGTSVFRVDTINQPYSLVAEYFDFVKNDLFNYNLFIEDDFSGLDGEYSYSNDSFLLLIQLVTKKPGVFYLRQGSSIRAGISAQQDFPGKCYGMDFDVWTNMNDGGDNNIDFLTESPDFQWNTWTLQDPINRFHHWGGYCFKVLE